MSFKRAAVFLLFFCANAYAAEFPVEIVEYVGNTRVVAFIDEQDIAESRQWQPFEEEPPLAMNDAIDVLQKFIASNKEFTDTELLEIELRKLPRHEQHWHYMFKTRTTINEASHQLFFVVLMNGKIIPAIREPETLR